MVKVGIAGIGFMGVTHFKALQAVPGARVAAIFTRDPQKLAGDWSGVQGNFGDAGGRPDLTGVARYADFADLIADPEIDLVDICLPTPLHREATIAALRAGKHVLVEKPLALTLEDADAMLAAAQDSGRMLLCAHVLRFIPAFAEAHAIVQSGEFGAVQGVHLRRIIGRKSPEVETRYFAESGGPLLDLHIHDTDFILHLLGTPLRVRTAAQLSGAHTAGDERLRYFHCHYDYGPGAPCVTAQCGAIGEPPLTFEHGFDIYMERATLRYNNLFTGEALWLCSGGQKQELVPQRPDGFAAQLQHAVQCVQSGTASELISAQSARASLALCLLEKASAECGQAVEV